VVDVQNTQVIALRSSLTVVVGITQSQALSGLAISLLEEALRQSRQVDQTQVGAWLLAQFQNNS